MGFVSSHLLFGLLCGESRSPRANTELLVLLAMLPLLLAGDDFFLLHERYVYQRGIFLFYAICALSLLVRHYRWIIKSDGFAFLLVGMLLAFSVIIDMKQRKISLDYEHVQLIEEGCMFVGAALWLYFCGRTAAARMKSDQA